MSNPDGLVSENACRETEYAELVESARGEIDRVGIEPFSDSIGITSSNLQKILRGERQASDDVVERMRKFHRPQRNYLTLCRAFFWLDELLQFSEYLTLILR